MKRKKVTTNAKVKASIRRHLWLTSPERSQALSNSKYCCERCGVKGRAKDTKNGPKQRLEVHHRDGIDWDGLADLIRRRVLPHADRLEVLCPECHGKEHGGDE